MSDDPDLERRYRRLLAGYPAAFRREYEQEILSVLMAGAEQGQRWPRLAEAADLLRSATFTRLRTRWRTSWAWEYKHRRVMVPVRVAIGIWLVILTGHPVRLWRRRLVGSAADPGSSRAFLCRLPQPAAPRPELTRRVPCGGPSKGQFSITS
jgi:hypothetical protein